MKTYNVVFYINLYTTHVKEKLLLLNLL